MTMEIGCPGERKRTLTGNEEVNEVTSETQ